MHLLAWAMKQATGIATRRAAMTETGGECRTSPSTCTCASSILAQPWITTPPTTYMGPKGPAVLSRLLSMPPQRLCLAGMLSDPALQQRIGSHLAVLHTYALSNGAINVLLAACAHSSQLACP